MARIECRIGADHAGLAEAAAGWARGFHPDIEISIQGLKVTLSSQGRDAAELRLIWSAALFNESQIERQAMGRAAALEALLQ